MKNKTNPLWGGRFKQKSSDLLKKINNSISFDYKLASQDLRVSKAYCKALCKSKIISKKEENLIVDCLKSIENDILGKKLKFNDDFEDIHMNIEMELKKSIIGQDYIISAIAKTIIRSRVGISDGTSPIGSFLFLGSTGVGKTETAKNLAEFLFNKKDALIRIDMSEYMEKHSVSRLIGAPPGYIGYDEGGVLTEAVRRRPYRVILFDEVEKAHGDVLNLLLQVMDDGRLTDSHGKTVDFTNTIIIMTSNVGAKHFNTNVNFSKDNAKEKLIRQKVMDSVKFKFAPEFLNRLDEVLFFSKLGKSHVSKIVEIQLNHLKKRLISNNFFIEWENEVNDTIALLGYDPEYGARPIKRKIRTVVEDEISKLIINNAVKNGDTILISAVDNIIRVNVK